MTHHSRTIRIGLFLAVLLFLTQIPAAFAQQDSVGRYGIHTGPSLIATASRQAAPTATPATTCTLVIHIDGFRNQKGDAGVSLFTSADGWPEDNNKAFLHGPHPFSGTSTTVTLQVPPGRYAIAALHDENSNHKLDRNIFGIPKEGFGFSNNPKVFLSAPSFDTAAIPVSCPTTETTIHLIYKLGSKK